MIVDRLTVLAIRHLKLNNTETHFECHEFELAFLSRLQDKCFRGIARGGARVICEVGTCIMVSPPRVCFTTRATRTPPKTRAKPLDLKCNNQLSNSLFPSTLLYN